MINSKYPIVNNMKEDFEIFMEGTSWDQYWSSKNLLRKEFWADEVFVRATAWFLKLDIVLHQDVHGLPEKIISGNIENENVPCEGPRLHIGYLLNRHYQSILPRNTAQEFQSEEISEFLTIEIEKSSSEKIAPEIPTPVCPVCGKAGKNVLNHIKKSKNCSVRATEEQIQELRQMSSSNNKLKQKEYQKEYRKRKLEEDPNQVRENNKRRRADERERHPERIKEQNEKYRSRMYEADRLKSFLESTLFGAIFVCLSCHQRHFRTNVQVFSDSIEKLINEKMSSLENCIESTDPLSKMNYGAVFSFNHKKKNKDQFICKTCLSYFRRAKLPPTNVLNGLSLKQTDKQIQDDDLMLTELENSLIASRIIFQKVFALPVSRWSAMKERQVNIPITSDKINETLEKLPRTPINAGLIGVELKRQIKSKNNHKHQLIDPHKLFLFIDKAKEFGNPHFKDVLTFESYKQKCKNSNNDFKLVFGDIENDVDENSVMNVDEDNLTDEIDNRGSRQFRGFVTF